MNWSKRGKEVFFNGFKGTSWTHQHSLSPNIEIQFNLSCREKINHFQRSWNQWAAFQVVKLGAFLITTICSVLTEKVMAPHRSTLAWKIPWTEEPGGLQSMGSRRLDTTERLHFHFSLSYIGEGNGNPLQCSCLENPRDGGSWWAAVYGVTQSWTRLKRLSSSSSSSSVLNFSTWFDHLAVAWVVFNSRLFQSPNQVHRYPLKFFQRVQIHPFFFWKSAPYRKWLHHMNAYYSSNQLSDYWFYCLFFFLVLYIK